MNGQAGGKETIVAVQKTESSSARANNSKDELAHNVNPESGCREPLGSEKLASSAVNKSCTNEMMCGDDRTTDELCER